MAENPYQLSADRVLPPPTSFAGKLRFLGPGFILSASIVGSGELIMTTLLGAKAGFVCLWVIIFSCLVKVAMQLEFGKHAISSGESPCQGRTVPASQRDEPIMSSTSPSSTSEPAEPDLSNPNSWELGKLVAEQPVREAVE